MGKQLGFEVVPCYEVRMKIAGLLIKNKIMKIEKEYIVEAIGNNQDILYEWIEVNKDVLDFVSEDEGCGCCVSIFKIKGQAEVLKTFPKEILL